MTASVVSHAGAPVIPTGGFNTPGYLFEVFNAVVGAKGAQRASFDFRFNGEACGQANDLSNCEDVAVHYFAVDTASASSPPTSAGAIMDVFGDGRDLLSNRAGKVGFTYLRTQQLSMQCVASQLIEARTGAAVESEICFTGSLQMNLPCLDNFPVAAADKQAIAIVVVARDYINSARATYVGGSVYDPQGQALLVDYTVSML